MADVGWNRKWFLRGLRLSLFIGVAMSGLKVWQDYSNYQVDVKISQETERGYQCAARLEDAVLLAAENAYGAINVRQFGCSDRAFFVRMDEIKEVRSGTMTFSVYSRPFNIDAAIFSFFAGMLISVIVTGTALGTVNLARWIWGL